MSGRSGYRKTDRKRSRRPVPRVMRDHVLRFQLPPLLASFVSPGLHSYGATIGYNDLAFISGQRPSHCCQLAADFLDSLGARQHVLSPIAASMIKLLPCPAHHLPASRGEGFGPLGIDLEAVHDRISRNCDRAKPVAIAITPLAISFSGTGIGRKSIVHDYAGQCASDRERA